MSEKRKSLLDLFNEIKKKNNEKKESLEFDEKKESLKFDKKENKEEKDFNDNNKEKKIDNEYLLKINKENIKNKEEKDFNDNNKEKKIDNEYLLKINKENIKNKEEKYFNDNNNDHFSDLITKNLTKKSSSEIKKSSFEKNLKEKNLPHLKSTLQNNIKKNLNDKNNEKRYEFLLDIKDRNLIKKGQKNYDPSTLHIPNEYFNKFTPFEKQFWKIKMENFDTIICFKKGKFYELYEEDAVIASNLFDFKITERVNMKMSGFPEKSFDVWANKFLQNGYKIGRVEQKENAISKSIRKKEEKNSKETNLIERILVEVITAGTIYNLDFLNSPLPIYLSILVENKNCSLNCSLKHHFSILLYDASINKIILNTFCDKEDLNTLKTIFAQNDIKEIITDFNIERINKEIKKINLSTFLKLKKEKKEFLNLINLYKKEENINYIINNNKNINNNKIEILNDNFLKNLSENINIKSIDIEFINQFLYFTEFKLFIVLYLYFTSLKREKSLIDIKISYIFNNDTFSLNRSVLENLDIFVNNYDFTENKSFYSSLNYCNSHFGQRLLKKWVSFPLKNKEKILKRQIYSEFFNKKDINKFIDKMKEITDLERLFIKINNKENLKELEKYIFSLNKSIEFLDLLIENNDENVIYQEIFYDIPLKYNLNIKNILKEFNENYIIKDEKIKPLNPNDNFFIYKNKFIKAEEEFEHILNELKIRLKNKDINYKHINKDLFQVEVPSEIKMPNDFFLVSSIKNKNRYYNNEIKEKIVKYKEIEEKIFQSEFYLLKNAIEFLKRYNVVFNNLIDYLAKIDCFMCINIFNRINKNNQKPIFNEEYKFEIKNFTNPIYKDFIKNDFLPSNKISILTGPNMGGKSTYLRSICLNIILAQIGFNVPCENMKMPVFDNIFTRIGASDSLIRNESTFYMEMNELSTILNNSTQNTFIIIDELGRGTSTKDGEAISKSVLNYLKKLNTFSLFSTHFHNLALEYEGVNKLNVKFQIENEDIIFLYKVEEGVCLDSHGIYIAKLANIPIEIINRAKEIRKMIKKNI